MQRKWFEQKVKLDMYNNLNMVFSRWSKESRYLLFVDCLKSGAPSSMVGDVFFNFTCTDCAEDGQEDVNRMKMQWFVAADFPWTIHEYLSIYT